MRLAIKTRLLSILVLSGAMENSDNMAAMRAFKARSAITFV